MKMVLKVEVYRGVHNGYEWSRPFRQAIIFNRTNDVDIWLFVDKNNYPKQLYLPSKNLRLIRRWTLSIERLIELQKAIDGVE